VGDFTLVNSQRQDAYTPVKAQIGIDVIAVHLSFNGTAEEFKNNKHICCVQKTFKVFAAIKRASWKYTNKRNENVVIICTPSCHYRHLILLFSKETLHKSEVRVFILLNNIK